eukprot:1014983-Amphidinium_carterae.1
MGNVRLVDALTQSVSFFEALRLERWLDPDRLEALAAEQIGSLNLTQDEQSKRWGMEPSHLS